MSDDKTTPQNDANFGNGEVGGDNRYESPVYGTNDRGHEGTYSFGRNGNTSNLAADHYVSGEAFYADGGHDHYDSHGNTRSNGDKGAYTGL